MPEQKDHFGDWSRLVLIGVSGWIAISVAHLPAIEQKLDDYVREVDNKLSDYDARIKKLEPSR